VSPPVDTLDEIALTDRANAAVERGDVALPRRGVTSGFGESDDEPAPEREARRDQDALKETAANDGRDGANRCAPQWRL
jgi:hypothetical protein